MQDLRWDMDLKRTFSKTTGIPYSTQSQLLRISNRSCSLDLGILYHWMFQQFSDETELSLNSLYTLTLLFNLFRNWTFIAQDHSDPSEPILSRHFLKGTNSRSEKMIFGEWHGLVCSVNCYLLSIYYLGEIVITNIML